MTQNENKTSPDTKETIPERFLISIEQHSALQNKLIELGNAVIGVYSMRATPEIKETALNAVTLKHMELILDLLNLKVKAPDAEKPSNGAKKA